MLGERTKKTLLYDEKGLSIIVFSLFSSWFLAFPFQGQVLFALAGKYALDVGNIIFITVAAHFLGLITCGLFVKNAVIAKKVMIYCPVICIVISLFFFWPLVEIFPFLLGLASFLAGVFIAAWGFYFKAYTPPGARIKTAADVLIISNILMIFINAASVLISANVGLTFSICVLIGALYLATRLKMAQENGATLMTPKSISAKKPLLFLCLFIVVITINSGLMYQVINPSFAHHAILTSWYWAVPYIIALIIMRNLPRKTNRAYILYVAIAMIGFAFIFFMILDRSLASYLLIDTLLLGACGVCDLFWWSIIGEMLDFSDNPARIFGIGLSANVLGVLIGGLIGSSIYSLAPNTHNPTIIALIVLFVILLILPLLNKVLFNILSDHTYLSRVSIMPEEKQKEEITHLMQRYELTGREQEIVVLLLKGMTYKMIAAKLYLSENTIKSHIKNIYSKLNVKSKSELVNLFLNKNII